MYRPTYEPPSPSPQPNHVYSPLNRLNLDMDMENLFSTQEYYAGQGSGQGSAQGGLNLNEDAATSDERYGKCGTNGWDQVVGGKKEGATTVLYRVEESGIGDPRKGKSGGSGVEKTET
ncbi:hypothetical protein Tco_0551097 [Tanacetum coccineum]